MTTSSDQVPEEEPQSNRALTAEKHLTRTQMLQYLMHKNDLAAQSSKPLVAIELFDPTNLALKTENPPHMVMAKVRLRLIVAAMDPKRKTSLIECFLQYYNEEMVSYKRQGRQEYLGALQALANEQSLSGEPTVSLR